MRTVTSRWARMILSLVEFMGVCVPPCVTRCVRCRLKGSSSVGIRWAAVLSESVVSELYDIRTTLEPAVVDMFPAPPPTPDCGN